MRRKRLKQCLAASAVLGAAPLARAGGGAATDAYADVSKAAPVDVHGVADVYAQRDLRGATPKRAPLRAFDAWTGPSSIGLLGATLAHRPDALGFRLDAGVGDTANAYEASDPAATSHPDLTRALSYVQQAFASAILPLGRGLGTDLGKFSTPVGLEENDPLHNWNYSRSLLFTLAEPTYHSGLRATYPVTDALGVSLFWLNGWNTNGASGNGMRSFAAALSWKTERFDVSAVYAGGLERAPTRLADPALAFRHTLNGNAVYTLTSELSFALSLDYGTDAAGQGAAWWGIAGYARYRLVSWLGAALRAEHFADPGGFVSGTSQRLNEATFTVEARKEAGSVLLLGRLEYRREQSDARVFSPDGAPLTRRDTVTLAIAAAF
jgi:hypothetical protein